MLLFGGGAPSTPRTLPTMRLRPRPRLRARAKDRSLDRKLLSLRCDPEQYSTLLCPPVTCNHSCIRQELACYRHSRLSIAPVAVACDAEVRRLRVDLTRPMCRTAKHCWPPCVLQEWWRWTSQTATSLENAGEPSERTHEG